MKKQKKSLKPYIVSSLAVGFFLFYGVKDQGPQLHSHSKVFNQAAVAIEKTNPSNSRSIASLPTRNVQDKRNRKIAPTQFEIEKKRKFKISPDQAYSYKSLSPGQGPDFQNGVSRYKFLDHFYAIKNTAENRNRSPSGVVKLGYLIVKSETPIADSLAVVENTQTGHLGIFTGILKVKLQSMQDIDFVIGHHDYQVIGLFDHINLVQYQIDDIGLAIKTNQQLQTNPKVVRASLEILEYARHHR